MIGELEEAQNAIRQLKENKKKLELDLRNTKKQFEAQELVCTTVHVDMLCTITIHSVDKPWTSALMYMYIVAREIFKV